MRFCAILWILLAGTALIGCRERAVVPPSPPPVDVNTSIDVPIAPDPYPVLNRMVSAYQAAVSYSDRATIQIIGKMSQPDTEPVPWNCLVVFQRPNRLRLEINEGIFVSDGEDCYAQIQPLPDQVLHHPSPESWTLETLFQDVHLDNAMALGLPPSVLRFPPQLVLLFANNPLHTFCPKGATVQWLEQQQIGSIPCDIIRISHSDGNRILWISQETQALLRLDYQPVGLPVPEGFDSIEAIRIEMTGARFDWDFVPETFQMLQSQNAVQVIEFQSNTPGLPTPEEHRRRLSLMTDNDSYRLVDQQIESVIAPEQSPPPKVAPQTFTLTPVWTLPLVGVNAMALLKGEPPQLLVPCEGNLVAALNLQGNALKKNALEGFEDTIITAIQVSPSPFGKQKIGILTLDFKFFLFDESFKPAAVFNVKTDEDKKEKIRDFQFVQHHGEGLLLLGIQQNSVSEHSAPDTVISSSILRAVDMQGTKRWEYPFEGMLGQISSATIGDQSCVLVSRTVSQQDSILILSPDGTVLDSVDVPFGRHALWFHVLGSTIYTLLENTDTGDVRIVGLDRHGKGGLWSRLLPPGEYETVPVYVPTEKKWLVPLPDGEIRVFDLLGNIIDTFSLNVVPTGLFCVEVEGTTLLIVADGETISAWKVGKISGTPMENQD